MGDYKLGFIFEASEESSVTDKSKFEKIHKTLHFFEKILTNISEGAMKGR